MREPNWMAKTKEERVVIDLEEKLATLTRELKEAKEKWANVANDRDFAKSQVDERDIEISRLRAKVARLERELKEVSKRYEICYQQVNQAERERDHYREEVKRLNREWPEKSRTLINEIIEPHQQLEGVKEDWREQFLETVAIAKSVSEESDQLKAKAVENEHVFLVAGASAADLRLQFDIGCRLLNQALQCFEPMKYPEIEGEIIGFLARNDRLEKPK